MSPKLLLESVALRGLGLHRHPLAKRRGSHRAPQGDDGEQHAAGSSPSQCHPCNEPRLHPAGAELSTSHTQPLPLAGVLSGASTLQKPIAETHRSPKGTEKPGTDIQGQHPWTGKQSIY